MSTTYPGNPDNVSTSLAATVTDASNATPIVITTSAAHAYGDGDYVDVASVGGNTAANGSWRISVLSPTTFELDGSVGNGAYTAGGTCIDHSFTPAMTQPSDGDLRSAASVNLALDILADRTQFLVRRTRAQVYLWTASGTIVVPDDVYVMTFEGVGGGGGGGGGMGNGAGRPGTGGGGAKRSRVTAAVVPGETITIVCGPGGTAGAGGSAAGGAAGSGGHGDHTTVTGSTSGLLATFRGAMGGNLGAATATGAMYGGLPSRYAAAQSNQYVMAGVLAAIPVPPPYAGQGGVSWGGSGTESPRDFRSGGSTAYAEGGYGGTVAANNGYAGAGGASEWPGGDGADSNNGAAGSNGAFGSGASGGAEKGAGVAGTAGGVGGVGVCQASYFGGRAVTT